MGELRPKTWLDHVKPIINKCEVATAFDGQAVFNAEGARALGKLLKDMAEKLDYVIAEQESGDILTDSVAANSPDSAPTQKQGDR